MAKLEEIPDEDAQRAQAPGAENEGEGADDEYDLDAPAVSNFLSREYETISPRELTFRDTAPGQEVGFPLTTVVAFVLAASVAHWLLVTQGFLGKQGTARQEAVWKWFEGVLTKWSIALPKDWDQPPAQKVEL